MTNITSVEKTLDSVIGSKELTVVVLKGAWGIGKTYFWEKYINDKKEQRSLTQTACSYVSLFGLRSLTELKSKILSSGELLRTPEEAQTRINGLLGRYNQIVSTFLDLPSSGQNILRFVSKWLPMGKTLPQIQAFSLFINSLEYALIDNYIICIDDIERSEKELTIGQLMGLVDELSKKKNCKIILILNEQTLSEEANRDFRKYREKIVDLEIEYKPTTRQNLLNVIDDSDAYFTSALEVFQFLNLSNIRIFRKLKWSLSHVRSILNNCEPVLQKQVVSHLAFFCWLTLSSDCKISVSYIQLAIKTKTWLPYLLDREIEEQIDEEEREWGRISSALSIYLDDYDECLISLMTDGYLNVDQFQESIYRSNSDRSKDIARDKMFQAWSLYSDSFADNLEEIKSAFRDVLDSSLDKTDLGNFDVAICFLQRYGEPVDSYISNYLDIHSSSLAEVNLEDFRISRRIRNTQLTEGIQKLKKEKKDLHIDDVLDHLVDTRGWSQEELSFLSSLTSTDIQDWLSSNPNRLVRKVREGLLGFKDMKSNDPQQSQSYQTIYTNTKEALSKIAEQSSLNRERAESIYGSKL